MFLKDGSWSFDAQALQSEAIGFFQDLFCNTDQVNPACLVNLEGKVLDDTCSAELTREVTKVEVWEALKYMKSFKAPGPDGFQSFFFKQYWHLVGDKVHDIVRSAFREGSFDKEIAETLIVLIPKEDNPSRITQFPSISLCNMIYKLITKVLVNRIRPFLIDFIDPLQSIFIPGRSTHDNILVAQEITHSMHKSTSKKGYLAYKIDLEKTYDRVDWCFLQKTLEDFRFPQPTIRPIMLCVSSSSLSLLWNGNKLPTFSPKRGLRQGDPPSPYLFVICMEKLSLLIHKKVDMGSGTRFSAAEMVPKYLTSFLLMIFCSLWLLLYLKLEW